MNKKRTEDKKTKKLFNLKTQIKRECYIHVFMRLTSQKTTRSVCFL